MAPKSNTAFNLITLLVFSVLLIGAGVAGYLISPTVHHPEILKENYDAAQSRFKELQSQARLPEKNGFLSETFNPYWGVPTAIVDGCAAQKAIEGWSTYSQDAQIEKVDHVSLLVSKDVNYLEARQDFEKLLPDLISDVQKPYFLVQSNRVTSEMMIMNLIRVRTVTQVLSAYLDSKSAEGKPADALSAWQAGFSLAAKMPQGQTLIYHMMGVAMQAMLNDSAYRNLGPKTNLTYEQWLALSRETKDKAFPENELLEAMQGEYLSNVNSLDDLAKGRNGSSSIPSGNPLLIRREERIYKNYMAEVFLHLHNPGSPPPVLEEFSILKNLLGKSGVIATLLATSTERASTQMQITRGKTAALSAYFGLQAYRTKYGEYPKELGQLVEIGLEPLQGLAWNNQRFRYETGEKPRLVLDFPAGLLASVSANNKKPEGSHWVEFTTDSLVMRL